MPDVATAEEGALIVEARRLAAIYDDMREMIRIGAYQKGASAEVDRAIIVHEKLERFLGQSSVEKSGFEETFALLNAALA
jgi:flagellum-specific ATP synthase